MTQVVLPHTIDAGTEITAVEHQENYVALRDTINGLLEGGSGAAGNIKANGITARELADLIMVQGLGTPSLQQGVVGVTGLRITPGAGLTANYSSGTAWITDDSGLVATGALLPAVVTGASVTAGAAHATNPRIDQVIATLTGYGTATVSVLAGTATAGATLDNRNGAAALPNDAILLADLLIPATFTGPFVQHTNIRERMTSARLRYVNANEVATFESVASASYTDLATSGPALTLPFEGIYLISYGAQMHAQNAGGATVRMGWALSGAETLAAADSNSTYIVTNSSGLWAPGDRVQARAMRAGTVVTPKYKVSTGTGDWEFRWLRAELI